MGKPSLLWQIYNDVATVAKIACDDILVTAQKAIAERGCFRIVLAGGSTPRQTYQQLRQAQADWQYWFIYYGDERCLPVDDEERNSVMATSTWLNHVGIKCEHVYPIPAELGAVEASKQYTEVIAKVMPFDLVLLGMGEDGHTASLFPGHCHATTEWVQPVFNAPKPPAERVTLTLPALSYTRKILFLVTGENKREAVSAWKRGENLPVNQIVYPHTTKVLLDRAASDD
jgi:6-phosphogluconolactonase